MKKLLLLFIFVPFTMLGQIANSPEDLSQCDDNGDGFETFNLTINNPIVTGSQNPADLEITYHTTQADADLGINNIASSSSYFSNTATLWVRVFEIPTGNFEYESFEVIVNPLPNATTPSDLEVCDDDNDGFSMFDLTIQDDIITNGDPALVVTYHAKH